MMVMCKTFGDRCKHSLKRFRKDDCQYVHDEVLYISSRLHQLSRAVMHSIAVRGTRVHRYLRVLRLHFEYSLGNKVYPFFWSSVYVIIAFIGKCKIKNQFNWQQMWLWSRNCSLLKGSFLVPINLFVPITQPIAIHQFLGEFLDILVASEWCGVG